jgi:hypothetical protein
MMLLLVGDVLNDLRRSGWADRKSAVPVLPVKVPKRRRLRLDPFRRGKRGQGKKGTCYFFRGISEGKRGQGKGDILLFRRHFRRQAFPATRPAACPDPSGFSPEEKGDMLLFQGKRGHATFSEEFPATGISVPTLDLGLWTIFPPSCCLSRPLGIPPAAPRRWPTGLRLRQPPALTRHEETPVGNSP